MVTSLKEPKEHANLVFQTAPHAPITHNVRHAIQTIKEVWLEGYAYAMINSTMMERIMSAKLVTTVVTNAWAQQLVQNVTQHTTD